MLKLYDLKEINIKEWKKEDSDVVLESNGEFDLSYCLKNIEYQEPNFYGIQKIIVKKLENNIKLEIQKEEKIEIIEMTNLKFEIE